MKKLLKQALNQIKLNKSSVLVTIVEADGSTPRKIGASMVVGDLGLLSGSIGGGALEQEAISTAMDFLGKSQGKVIKYDLSNENAGELGMICGGKTEVLYTPLSEMESILWKDEKTIFSLPLDGSSPKFLNASEKNLIFPQVNQEKTEISFPFTQGGRVFLFGAGHVSQALSQVLIPLEFPMVIVDDRAEFCHKSRFPIGELCQVSSFTNLHCVFPHEMAPKKEDAICIMTRGHGGDLDVLRFALQTSASYLGLMGSVRKKEKLFTQLKEEGVSEVENRVHIPIGLPILAETPEEIAISIAAQLLAWRGKQRRGEE